MTLTSKTSLQTYQIEFRYFPVEVRAEALDVLWERARRLLEQELKLSYLILLPQAVHCLAVIDQPLAHLCSTLLSQVEGLLEASGGQQTLIGSAFTPLLDHEQLMKAYDGLLQLPVSEGWVLHSQHYRWGQEYPNQWVQTLMKNPPLRLLSGSGGTFTANEH